MRELHRRHGAAANGLLAVAAGCLFVARAAAADTMFVRPGQTDVTLTVEIENEADSGADIASAQVNAVPSESAPVTNIRISPAVAIPIGQVKTFTVTFDIAGTANEGEFSLTLQDIINDAVDPDPATNDLVRSFIGSELSFLVGAQLRAVWQDRAFSGLKLSAGLPYRQAGRQAWEALTSEASQAPVVVRAPARGATGASFLGVAERFVSRRGALAGPDARKVMSQARKAKSLAAFARGASFVGGGDLKVTRNLKAHKLEVTRSASGTRTCGLPVYIECPSRIRTWESRFSPGVPEGTRTPDLLVHSGSGVGAIRATWRARSAGSSARSTTRAALRREIVGYAVAWLRQAGHSRAILARFENVVGELALARGGLFAVRGVTATATATAKGAFEGDAYNG
jgi:hypothetical protein